MFRFILFITFIISSAQSTEVINHDFIKSSASGENIEIFWSRPSGTGPWPLLVLLHPHQEWPDKIGAEAFVKNKTIEAWVKNNFVTVALSFPGYGKTEGSADFCGPLSQSAALDVISHFESMLIIEKNKTFLYGGSRGAVVASLLAVKHKYAGVFLKSGLYDFEEAYDSYSWYTPIKITMIWELGFNNRKKLKERSVTHSAEKFTSPLLLIHGSADSRASLEIAKKFSERVRASGQISELLVLESEHFISMEKIRPEMEKFFNKFK
jgi:dipeptidyl aminopeptidase/acylaminoacyl peptidase